MSDLTLSLQRLGALLELFARERRPMSSAEIGAELRAPRSSVAALLKALVQMNWLAHDRRAATYMPTAKFATMGAWVLEESLLSPPIVAAVQALQDATGETISLSAPADLALEVLHVIGPDRGIRLVIEVGTRLALWGTAIGTAYLATVADPTIRSMYRRTEAANVRPAVSFRTAMAAVRRARDNDGIAFAESAVVPDVAAMSVALPEGIAPRRLIVSIGGPVSRIRARHDEIDEALRTWLDRLADDHPRATPASSRRTARG